MLKLLFVLFLAIVFPKDSSATLSRISIENNGYEDILIALPKKFPPKNRFQLISRIRNLLQQSSSLLHHITKGRAKYHSAVFLIPEEWGDTSTWLRDRDKSIFLDETGTRYDRDNADILVTNPDTADHPYTVHHQGCGKQALRIYLPANFSIYGDFRQKGAEFVRLWSEFRYGVFPEGGFQDDQQYPLFYNIPGEEENRTTDCVNRPFRIPEECEVAWNCDKNQVIPSIMDQHYTNGTFYCEGHFGLGQIHVPDALTKQNLLCNEEGTYFTVLRSPDFKNGRNAAPRKQLQRDISFRYIKEYSVARVLVAIDTSSRSYSQNEYSMVKSAFYRFVLHDLPAGSILSVLTFEEDEIAFLTTDLLIDGLESRKEYLERQILPDLPSETTSSCPSCALLNITQLLENSTGATPHIILVTASNIMENSTYNILRNTLKLPNIYLHVLMLPGTNAENLNESYSLYSLCKETDNQFIYLGGDILGNLYSAFASSLQGISKNVFITQDYLNTLDEEVLFFPITVDETITQKLTITLSGPSMLTPTIKFINTVLKLPNNIDIHPEKEELIPAWTFHVSHPTAGTYTLRTWRYKGATSPILVTATGQPSENDTISARVWIETVDIGQIHPSPIQIFAEVRIGSYPVVNASVVAYVQHPNNDRFSEIVLLDDGLGNVDTTKNDGIYSCFFTNFTSTGFYNVYLEVTGSYDDVSAILKGPSTYCCGSNFPAHELIPLKPFKRQAGPVTFKIASIPEHDQYPPAKITDLRVIISSDLMFSLQWSAVGNNYDSGVASRYELKVFHDRSLIRNGFFDSGLEVYNETIENTEKAAYGTSLFHSLKFSQHSESGLYFVAICAYDDAGNHGDPSNAVAIFIDSNTSNKNIDCDDSLPLKLPLEGNSALSTPSSSFIIYLLAICFVKYYILLC